MLFGTLGAILTRVIWAWSCHPSLTVILLAYNERLCGYFEAIPLFIIPTTNGRDLLLSAPSLSALQVRDQSDALEMSSNLRTYFTCLTAALAYLYDQNIRHKDIKPQNILICKGNILFADFGMCCDFADDAGSTTSGLTPASPRYSAPEVAAYKARNTSSDVWSLGCVFLEMTAALHGLNIDWMKAFFAKSSSGALHFHTNPAAIAQFIQALKDTAHSTDKSSLIWTKQMLSLERRTRPTCIGDDHIARRRRKKLNYGHVLRHLLCSGL
jgi:serine/threonine protein kinase